MAEQIIAPCWDDPEKVRAIRDAIGDGYFAQTLTATRLALLSSRLGVTVPSSSAASRARKALTARNTLKTAVAFTSCR